MTVYKRVLFHLIITFDTHTISPISVYSYLSPFQYKIFKFYAIFFSSFSLPSPFCGAIIVLVLREKVKFSFSA